MTQEGHPCISMPVPINRNSSHEHRKCVRSNWRSRKRRCSQSSPISLFLHTNHYLFPSIPNVHAVSAQTTGTVMEVYFPDGSHLPASPLLSLAHLWDDSQHISLAAICLSAFTANQTSEQPNSPMGGGLETCPAYLPALLHLFLLFPCSTSSTPSLVKTCSLLCFIFQVLICDPTLIFISLWPPWLFLVPPPPRPPPFLFSAGRVQRYIRLFLRESERCACRPSWQREQQSLTWTYAVRAPIYNYFS